MGGSVGERGSSGGVGCSAGSCLGGCGGSRDGGCGGGSVGMVVWWLRLSGGGMGVWFFGKGANNADVRGVVRGQRGKEVSFRGDFNRLVLQLEKKT